MRAELRVIFNPLCNTMPLFGGLTYFFLRTPVSFYRCYFKANDFLAVLYDFVTVAVAVGINERYSLLAGD